PQDLQWRQGQWPAQGYRYEHGEHLGDVAREQVVDEARDVGVDDAALLDRPDDGAEVVIAQDHGRRLLGHGRAPDAHGDADVGAALRRGVVDTVAGHRHDLALALQRLYDPQLVLGRNAGENRRIARHLAPASLVEPFELRGVDGSECRAVRGAVDAQLPRYRLRGAGLITGDHHHPYARPAATLDRGDHLFAQRVDHAEQADEHEVAFRFFWRGVWRQLAVGDRQHPERVVRERAVGLE